MPSCIYTTENTNGKTFCTIINYNTKCISLNESPCGAASLVVLFLNVAVSTLLTGPAEADKVPRESQTHVASTILSIP